MSKNIRILFSILTLLTFLVLMFTATWSVLVGLPVLLTIVCLLISVACAVFMYRDYKYLFGDK